MNYKGVIIEESLETRDLLKLCRVVSSRISINDDPKTNAGEREWTLDDVLLEESKVKEVVELLSMNLKLPNWWADLSCEEDVYIIFHHKIFNGKNTDIKFRKKVIDYAHSLNLLNGQIPLGGNINPA